jgi:small-conductance mechanosensitive channel
MFFGIVNFIPNLITIIIIIIIFRYIIKGLRSIADGISKEKLKIKGFYPDWAHPTFNIIRILLYAFMFVLIFPRLPGSDSTIFKGVSVFIGVIFSLGSTTIINNVISGLVLTYMRPFTVGDRIKIGDVIGNVTEKTPFVIRIKTPKNEEITIPNSNIMAAQTFNYSESARAFKLILHTEVTFGYETPWRQVHELLLSVAKLTPDVLEDPPPFILQTALDDFFVKYQLNVYVIDADKMPRIYSDLRQNIQDVFREAGIELVSPHYHAYRDGSKSTVPAT